MRLLSIPPHKSSAFPKLVSFRPNEIPPYAILSHTWEHDEIEFPHIQNLKTGEPDASTRKDLAELQRRAPASYSKIMGACRLARKDGFDYIWIDSCCINKDSSAELSEALNSMYQHYKRAIVCYVYLSDVRDVAAQNPRLAESDFRQCKWFTRGWTLQELLASSELSFYAKDWTMIGTKRGLHDAITATTGIPTAVLLKGDTRSISIAQKMSWAARRETTRVEDQAYCLMGIFGVNMSPIYGEGLENAFLRLQLEIIKFSNDRSIFAWTALSGDKSGWEGRGLLASSPYEFRFSGSVGPSEWNITDEDSSYSMTNSGLRIYLPLSASPDGKCFRAFLNCRDESNQCHVAVCLQHTRGKEYSRCRANKLILEPEMPTFSLLWFHTPGTSWAYCGNTSNKYDTRKNRTPEKSVRLPISFGKPGIVYFRNKQGSEFRVRAELDSDGLAAANIIIGSIADDNKQPGPSPILSRNSKNSENEIERVVESLPDNEMVILHLRKQPNKDQHRKLDIFIVPANPLIRDLSPTDLGVMVEVENSVTRLFDLKSIFPSAVSSQHFREERYYGVYCTIDPRRPFRVLLFKPQSSLSGFTAFAVILYVRNCKVTGWVHVVKNIEEKSNERDTVEAVLGMITENKNFKKHEEHEENVLQRLPRPGTITQSTYLVKAGIRRRQGKALQPEPGTHTAWIKLGNYF
ncbi:hypothetical protein D9758_005888 [Tetrapyrgos nigripes]|uniref:Heterokaryon incompatibility domain-containing protein n=1 Tax=Tetrapyrgos nigripes TaxID=182062 RepID=A0A8H5G304_9AGAR|nr:hypothetical protein D9758_005888 [Tetrapyrgos nigripes]